MILVTGASGKTGRAIIAALAGRGQAVRALVRRADAGPGVRAAGAAEVSVGDLEIAADLAAACAGINAIYHICSNLHPREIEIGALVLRCAEQAEVERFVFHSVLHPQVEAMPHHWRKLRVEEMIFESALAWTILQPAAYFQNLLPYWPAMVEQGVYRPPYAAETRLGMVDLEDVAEAAAQVLTQPGHVGAIYELAGSEVLTQSEVADVIGAVLGRPVRVDPMDRYAWVQAARERGQDEESIEVLLRMFVYYEQHGFWGNPFVLTQLLGRAPRTLAEFAGAARQRMAVATE